MNKVSHQTQSESLANGVPRSTGSQFEPRLLCGFEFTTQRLSGVALFEKFSHSEPFGAVGSHHRACLIGLSNNSTIESLVDAGR